MNTDTSGGDWTLAVDGDGIVWLALDVRDAAVNSLSRAVMAGLDAQLAEIERRRPPGVAVTSAKSGFIAGADIREFERVRTPDEALPLIRTAHAVVARLERLPCPTVAVINGYCLGGGLELALACRYRVLVDDPKATLALPEVMLGIHPGFGGTVRAVRLLGVTAAMDLMLTGRNIRPDKALALGLVDRVVSADRLRGAASELLRLRPQPRRAPLKERLLSLAPFRGMVAPRIEAQVARRARREHYPAPYAIVDLWRHHGASTRTGFEAEAQSVARLVCTQTSRNLVRAFLLQERLKALGGRDTAATGHVHVVGAGVMGGDIAAWCAQRGFSVTLQDRSEELIKPALERARGAFAKRLRTPQQVAAATERLTADVQGAGIERADVVIEAIFENEQAKRELYARVEPRMKAGALLATNTSSIMLESLSSVLRDPGRLVGLHFFNPVASMPLVEVIQSRITQADARTRALSFTRAIDKLPLPCLSAPGFLVNRVLMPYLSEAMLVAQEGVPLAQIDSVAVSFGMPVGPIELADTVGLDVCLHVGRILAAAFGRPAPDALTALVAAGKLGRKSGEGLYVWRDGKAVKPAPPATTPAVGLEDRLLLPMVNEAVAILRERIVADEDLIDAGVIFGSGFAPFRGGPLRYARDRGLRDVHARLLELEAMHGARFHPDDGWFSLLREPV